MSSLDTNKLNTDLIYKNSDFNFNKFLFPITKPSFSRIRNKIYRDFQYKLFFDGFVNCDKEYAGSGAVIFKNNNEIWSSKEFVGKNYSSIYAQYKGLILGLKAASDLNIKVLLVKSDSDLIHHLNSKINYDCVNLLNLYKESKHLEKKFDTVEYIHIDKDLNKQAFNLANSAVEDYLSYTEDSINDK
jgi:ribonuclease HI